MVRVMVDVDRTSAAAFASGTTVNPHFANAARALHDLAAPRIVRHHGHSRFTLLGGGDCHGILGITGRFNYTMHRTHCNPLDTLPAPGLNDLHHRSRG